MRILRHDSPGFARAVQRFDRRAVPPEAVKDAVADIIAAVRRRGDAALVDFARRFDGARLSPSTIRVEPAVVAGASSEVDAAMRRMIAASHRNVLRFARRGLRRDWKMTNAQGAEVGEIFLPFERVGVYVPGGSAPLVSTALMTVTLAAAAGVPEIVACTPCGADGAINPALLHALHVAGATEVLRIGGAHSVAAMAFGTKSIRPVAKIFGPGNKFVVEAKRQVVGAVAIDLLPGPSEILVLADDSARPDWIAADLLAQAEHGGDSEVVLVTDSETLLGEVRDELESQARLLSRQGPVRKVLAKGCTLVLVGTLEDGAVVANAFAPEHLSLVTRRERAIMPLIRTAGAIFLGGRSPVAVGDFLAGPSHTLPTGGAGKSFPGLTVDQFQRRTSIVRLDAESMRRSAPIVEGFSALEGLDAHGRSATIRLEPRRSASAPPGGAKRRTRK